MSDKQKLTVSYDRDPSMDLSEEVASGDFEQCLEHLRKVDPSIPPMPENAEFIPNRDYDSTKPLGAGNWPDTVDPLCAQARWWCEHFRLPLLAEDFNGGDKHAFWNALTQIAEHQAPPPAWLAAAMLKEFSEKASPKIGDGRGECVTPERAEAARQEYETIKTERQQGLADSMAEVARLREKGLHRKAETMKQQTKDKFKPTKPEIAEDMGISLAHLKRLLKLATDRETQRETIADRLP